MFKSKRIAGFALMGALLGAPVVTAQVPSQEEQQQQKKVDVSDEEMSTFAKVFQTIRMENAAFQQELAGVVQDGGLEIQRFNKIHEASVNPEVESDATSEEKEKHQKILGELEKKQVAFQSKIAKMIQEEGMSLERYEEIAMVLPNDPDLQEKLKKALGG